MVIAKFDNLEKDKKLKVISWQFKIRCKIYRTSLVAYKRNSHLLQQDNRESKGLGPRLNHEYSISKGG